mmetsp:Transcript_22995/g.25562  ORF Transcript_22995/g.25562 Transcript_22995/m.25562 type:complete len:259 (+) Transcript_22995:18-794(+)
MDATFEGYCEDIEELLEEIRKNIDTLHNISDEDAIKRTVRETNQALEEAGSLMKSINLSARGVKNRTVEDAQEKANAYKAETQQLRKDLLTIQQKKEREDLMGGTDFELAESKKGRDEYLTVRERSQRSNMRLKDSKRDAEELVTLGEGILDDLTDQRERIEESRSKLRGVNGTIRQAGNRLTEIGRRMLGNKIIRGIIVFVLIALIVLITYLAFFDKKRKSNTNPIVTPATSPPTTLPPTTIPPTTTPPTLAPTSPA